jgi:hypothetical protein
MPVYWVSSSLGAWGVMSLIFGAKKSATSEIKIGAKNEEKKWG